MIMDGCHEHRGQANTHKNTTQTTLTHERAQTYTPTCAITLLLYIRGNKSTRMYF